MPSVITANDLRSGAAVYLAPDGCWIEDIAAAAVAEDADASKRYGELAHAAVVGTAVTAVYAFDVRLVGGRPEPVSVRERIRAAHAPTI